MANTRTPAPTEFPAKARWYALDAEPPLYENGAQVLWAEITLLGSIRIGDRLWYRFEWFGEECYAHPGDLLHGDDVL